jgi:hypothetical protein
MLHPWPMSLHPSHCHCPNIPVFVVWYGHAIYGNFNILCYVRKITAKLRQVTNRRRKLVAAIFFGYLYVCSVEVNGVASGQLIVYSNEGECWIALKNQFQFMGSRHVLIKMTEGTYFYSIFQLGNVSYHMYMLFIHISCT